MLLKLIYPKAAPTTPPQYIFVHPPSPPSGQT